MKRIFLTHTPFILILVLGVLACGQIVTTPTATVANTPTPPPSPTATASPTPEPIIPGGPTRVTVLAAQVNVRAEPDGEVVGQIFAGQSVVVGECDENWCSISEPVVGWVWIGCLSMDSEKGCEAK